MDKTSHKVLIVEDEPIIAYAIGEDIRYSGHQPVGPASSPETALSIIESQQVDGAILDIELGNEKVFPVALQLTKCGIPFVFYCAHANKRKIELGYGAPVYLKPTNTDIIINSLIELIETSKRVPVMA